MLCRSPAVPPQGPISHTLSRTPYSPHEMAEPAGQPDNSKRAGAGSHTPTQTGWWIRILGWDWASRGSGLGKLYWARLAAQVSQHGRDFQNQSDGFSAHRKSSNPEPR